MLFILPFSPASDSVLETLLTEKLLLKLGIETRDYVTAKKTYKKLLGKIKYNPETSKFALYLTEQPFSPEGGGIFSDSPLSTLIKEWKIAFSNEAQAFFQGKLSSFWQQGAKHPVVAALLKQIKNVKIDIYQNIRPSKQPKNLLDPAIRIVVGTTEYTTHIKSCFNQERSSYNSLAMELIQFSQLLMENTPSDSNDALNEKDVISIWSSHLNMFLKQHRQSFIQAIFSIQNLTPLLKEKLHSFIWKSDINPDDAPKFNYKQRISLFNLLICLSATLPTKSTEYDAAVSFLHPVFIQEKLQALGFPCWHAKPESDGWKTHYELIFSQELSPNHPELLRNTWDAYEDKPSLLNPIFKAINAFLNAEPEKKVIDDLSKSIEIFFKQGHEKDPTFLSNYFDTITSANLSQRCKDILHFTVAKRLQEEDPVYTIELPTFDLLFHISEVFYYDDNFYDEKCSVLDGGFITRALQKLGYPCWNARKSSYLSYSLVFDMPLSLEQHKAIMQSRQNALSLHAQLEKGEQINNPLFMSMPMPVFLALKSVESVECVYHYTQAPTEADTLLNEPYVIAAFTGYASAIRQMQKKQEWILDSILEKDEFFGPEIVNGFGVYFNDDPNQHLPKPLKKTFDANQISELQTQFKSMDFANILKNHPELAKFESDLKNKINRLSQGTHCLSISILGEARLFDLAIKRAMNDPTKASNYLFSVANGWRYTVFDFYPDDYDTLSNDAKTTARQKAYLNLLASKLKQGGLKPNSNATNLKELINPLTNPKHVIIHHDPQVLSAFKQFVLQHPMLLGAAFMNPYTQEKERFPEKMDDLTIRHLVLLSHSECINTTGKTNKQILLGFSKEAFTYLHFLMKDVVITNFATIFRKGKQAGTRFDSPRQHLFIHQAGHQAQKEFYNSLIPYCYCNQALPDEAFTPDVLAQAYYAISGNERPARCSNDDFKADEIGEGNTLPHKCSITWGGKHAFDLDLNLLADVGFRKEFSNALDATIEAANQAKINEIDFSFLAAGLGAFAGALDSTDMRGLKIARLIGILRVLKEKKSKSDLSPITAMALPYSEEKADPIIMAILSKIQEALSTLNIAFLGANQRDALQENTKHPNRITASTTTGEFRTAPGNEGFPRPNPDYPEGMLMSVEAMLSGNSADFDLANVFINDNMGFCQRPMQQNKTPLVLHYSELDAFASLSAFFKKSFSIIAHLPIKLPENDSFQRNPENGTFFINSSLYQIFYSNVNHTLQFKQESCRTLKTQADQLNAMHSCYSTLSETFRQSVHWISLLIDLRSLEKYSKNPGENAFLLNINGQAVSAITYKNAQYTFALHQDNQSENKPKTISIKRDTNTQFTLDIDQEAYQLSINPNAESCDQVLQMKKHTPALTEAWSLCDEEECKTVFMQFKELLNIPSALPTHNPPARPELTTHVNIVSDLRKQHLQEATSHKEQTEAENTIQNSNCFFSAATAAASASAENSDGLNPGDSSSDTVIFTPQNKNKH